ncbi:hypothetical protein MMC22_009618 [Lobaria immixta]|nr:hypothetical protein [Lobaria immixta]
MSHTSQDSSESRSGSEHDRENSLEGALSDLDVAGAKETSDKMTFPEGGARAWFVAAGTAGVMFCTLGYINAFGVYQEYYQSHQLQDQSPSSISWIGSLQVFFLFAGGVVGGPLFDRYGAKGIWPAAVAFVFSVMMTSICKEYYQFLLVQGIVGGISAGMSMAPCMAATPQYFQKNRGIALGLAVAGSSLGGVIFPIALGKMLSNPRLGFGWTVRICGFIILVVLAISCAGIRARLPPRKSQFFLLSAFKDAHYVAVIGATLLMILGVFIPLFYLPTYAVEHGMNKELASYLLAILNGASLFGRVLPGLLADRFGRLNTLCAAGLSSGILILCWPSTTTSVSIIVFSALFGFCSGAIVSGVSVCLASCSKDPGNIGTYMGMGMGIASFAALVGPPVNGALVTHYNGYDQVSIFSGMVVLAGAVTVILAKQMTGQGVFAKI